MEITLVKIAQIDRSFPYCYHFQIDNPSLVDSVKEIGIVYPIILIQDQKNFVADGHRRLIAAVSAGLKELPAFVYDLKQIEATFLMGLQANLNSGDLTAIEKLKTYEIARERFTESGQEKIKQVLGIDRLSYLGLVAGSILKLPHLTQRYLHRQNFSMKALHQLISYDLSEFSKWLSLADELNLKGSELLNILEQVQDISLRDKQKPQTLLEDTKLKEILESSRTPQQKVQALKLFIFQKRFPLLNRMQTNIHTIQKELEKLFGSDVQILWDRSMENPGAVLQMNLKEEQQLSKMLTELQRPEVQDKIKKLLDEQNQLPEDI